MNAQDIYDRAPMGALIRYSDGTPQPPARFHRKLEDWSRRNDQGFLTRKEPAVPSPRFATPDRFILRKTAFSESDKPIAFIFNQLMTVASSYRFDIVSVPQPGEVLILQSLGDRPELVHIAHDEAAAEQWLAIHRYSNVVLETVAADPA